MKILIVGAGKMGLWLADSLCLDYDVAVFDKDLKKLRYLFKVERLSELSEVKSFAPDLCVNAVTLNHTIASFEELDLFLPQSCIISDISSVKTGLESYYLKSKRPYVSSHPMFGPTFASLSELSEHSAIIISESSEDGKRFFRHFYKSLGLKVYEYSFDRHDEIISSSLTIPFASTFLFTSSIERIDAPGTTFQKHMKIAEGLLSEDDFLLSEILFNPFSMIQLTKMRETLDRLMDLVKARDEIGVHNLLEELRERI